MSIVRRFLNLFVKWKPKCDKQIMTGDGVTCTQFWASKRLYPCDPHYGPASVDAVVDCGFYVAPDPNNNSLKKCLKAREEQRKWSS